MSAWDLKNSWVMAHHGVYHLGFEVQLMEYPYLTAGLIVRIKLNWLSLPSESPGLYVLHVLTNPKIHVEYFRGFGRL